MRKYRIFYGSSDKTIKAEDLRQTLESENKITKIGDRHFKRRLSSFASTTQETNFDFNNEQLLASFLKYKMPRFNITKNCVKTSVEQINSQLFEFFAIDYLEVTDIKNCGGGVTKKSECTIKCHRPECGDTFIKPVGEIQSLGHVCSKCNGRRTWPKIAIAKAIRNKVQELGGTILGISFPSNATDDKVNTQKVRVYCQCHCGYGKEKPWSIQFQNLQKGRWCPKCAKNLSIGDKYLDKLNEINPKWRFEKLDDEPLTNSSNVLGVCEVHHDPNIPWTPRVADLLKKNKPKGCGPCNGCVKAPLEEQFKKAQEACKNTNYTLIDKPNGKLVGVYTTYPILCEVHGRSDEWPVPFYMELHKVIYESFPRPCPRCSRELRNVTKLLNNLMTLDCNAGRNEMDLYIVRFEHQRVGKFYKVGIARNYDNRYKNVDLMKDDLKIIDVIRIRRFPVEITVLTEKWMIENPDYERYKLPKKEMNRVMKHSKGGTETFIEDITYPSLEHQVEKMLSDKCFWEKLNEDRANKLMSKARDVWEYYKSSIKATC